MDTQTEGAGPSRPRRNRNPKSNGGGIRDAQDTSKPSKRVLQWYADLVESHTQASIRHRIGLDYKEHQSLHDTSTWLRWTPVDQSCFFAALSRHSRLRADLVAYDCGKPESQVLLYLDSLDTGLAEVVRKDHSDQDGQRRRGRREGRAKSATEMTESWIQEEEVLSNHLMQDTREAERMDEEVQSSKRRKVERSTMKATSREEAGDRSERHRLKKEGEAELQSRWSKEDWGRAIGWEKLGQLDKLTRRSWCGWYGERVRQPAMPAATTPLDDHDQPSSPTRPRYLSKHHKIAMDNAALEALLAIDRKARSKQQRADLTKLSNRKRNRENTRIQVLLQSGKTEDQIKAEGGVDKAYLKSIGKDVEAESPATYPAESAVVAKIEPALPFHRAMPRSMSRQGTPMDASTVSEDKAALQDLRNMGIDTYLAEENLDIINFAALASQYQSPDISLPILKDIHESVKGYMRQLILQAILVAEAGALQISDDSSPAIEGQHVQYAIAAMESTQDGPLRVSLDPLDIESKEEDLIADSDDELGLTDEEDDGLDDAATDLDEKLDSAAELALWQAAEELSLPDLEPDNIIASRKAYHTLLASVGHARRHRHSIKRRSILFPSTGFRVPSRLQKRKAIKSAAFIEDSDEDMADDDVHAERERAGDGENDLLD